MLQVPPRRTVNERVVLPRVEQATLLDVLVIGVALLLALFVVPSQWGIVLIGSALAWEISEKAFWFWTMKRIPLAMGPETMVGRRVEVIAACRPDGKVRLQSERWKARCSEGAEMGDTVVVEAVEQLTLIVSSPVRGGWESAQHGRTPTSDN